MHLKGKLTLKKPVFAIKLETKDYNEQKAAE